MESIALCKNQSVVEYRNAGWGPGRIELLVRGLLTFSAAHLTSRMQGSSPRGSGWSGTAQSTTGKGRRTPVGLQHLTGVSCH